MIGKKAPNPKKASGKSARVGSLTAYITNPELSNGKEKCIHHEAENFITNDLQSQTLEMIALSHEAVRSKDPIDHYVLSWQEGEQPTIQQAREAVQMTMKHLGLEGHQVIWGMHSDTDNVHIHIEVNRVHPDTFKVVEINKGFQKNAIQQAAAIVEKVQGWKVHDKARFKTDELGHLITDSKTKLPQVFKDTDKPKQPTGQAKDKEIQTGEKSAQRICIEQAAPIIAATTSWKQLHADLAKVGIEYQRDGSGAKLTINGTAVKASDVVDRKNNFGALQKRLGLYQPANQPEIKNDPHQRTHLIDNPITNQFEQDTDPTGFSTFHTLQYLPSGDLDVTNKTTNRQTKTQNLLQFDESSDHRRTPGMRRRSDSDSTDRASRDSKNGRSDRQATRPQTRDEASQRSSQPVTQNQPGWTQYQQIKEANDSAKSEERLELSKRHDFEKEELKAAQKIEREAALKEVPKGQGAKLNAMRSLIADIQKPATQELQERHRQEREALQASYKPLPIYKVWQEQPQIVSEKTLPLIDQHITQDRQPQHVSQIIKQLTQRRDEHRHFTYALDKKDVFRDEGKIIKIIDLNSERGIAAALATAQQKYGDVLTLTGSDAFKQNAVAVAVEYNLTCRYDDPALEKLRTQFQAQKDAAVLEAAQAERDRAAAAQLEKSKEPAPLHSPSNKPEVSPVSVPSAEHQHSEPETEQPVEEFDEEVQNTQHPDFDDPGKSWHGDKIDYLDDIYQQLEIAKESASKYSPIQNPAIQATDEDHGKIIDSPILASNDQFIAVIVGKQVQILKLEILNQNVEYKGHASGVNRFAVGNDVSITPQRDGSIKTVISEERQEMQTEARRERKNVHGI